MVLLVLPPPDHLRIGPKWRQVLPCQQLTTPEQASCRDLATGPELRILNVAAHARIVSVARIRLGPRKSVRAFKGIICDDVSEFESYMPSHAVGSLWTSTAPFLPRWGLFMGGRDRV